MDVSLDAPVTFGWMMLADAWAVAQIEAEITPQPIDADEIVRVMKIRDVIGVVGRVNGRPVCYMVYQLKADHIAIVRLGVTPAWHRHGLGRCMVDSLKSRLGRDRKHIIVDVPERAAGLLAMLQRCGFWAVRLAKGNGPDGDDLIVMEYEHESAE